MRRLCAAIGTVGVILTSTAFGAGAADQPRADANVIEARRLASAAFERLSRRHPGVRVTHEHGQVRAVYGAPMTTGNTAAEAAAAFLDQHGDVFGVHALDLTPVWAADLSFGQFTVFAYEQTLAGTPVEYGVARVVVNNDLGRVVYAAGKLANRMTARAAPIAVAGDQALAAVQALDAFAALPQWSAPQLVIYAGEDVTEAPRAAWKFVGQDHDGVLAHARFTFFVDAATGALLRARDEILFIDVSGNAAGNGSPGTLPDIASNPPLALALPGLNVSIAGGNSAFTDLNGDFTIVHGGSGSVTVSANVNDGQYISVNDVTGGESGDSVSVTPPGPADLFLNAAPVEFSTSEINAFVHGNAIRNYIADRAPGFPGIISVDTTANVNIDSAGGITSCNAFWDGASINFFREKNGCVNSAYTTVIAHEYGHGLVQSLGLGQGAFGEGYGDTVATLLYNTPIVGEHFILAGGDIRNPPAANIQFPCSGGIHTCGQLLAGVWWDIRTNLRATYGNAAGLAMAQQMQVDWSLITVGGQGSNAAHPTTAIEVLTIDDDNGDLSDGTPNYADICTGFAGHSIDCPALQLVAFSYPNGRPDGLTPGVPTLLRVNIDPLSASPVPGTEILRSRTGLTGGFTPTPMTEIAPGQYEVNLPALACGQALTYFFETRTTAGPTAFDPAAAAAEWYSAVSAFSTAVELLDDFDADNGWAVGAPDDTATTGIWNRMDPEGTAAQPENDHTPGAGANCWITDGFAGGSLGARDVDGGKTTLFSPVFDLSAAAEATFSYYRWYSNDTGAAPNADVFVVEITNDGSTWLNVETVGPAGAGTSGGWIFQEFLVGDFVTPAAAVQLRFIASDNGNGSLVEAAIDDFRMVSGDCTSPPTCPEDVSGDGVIDLTDLAIVLANFGRTGVTKAEGDADGDGDVDLTDLATILGAFGQVCP